MTFEERVNEAVREELTAVDVDTAYDDMLNECYSFDSVGGPFAHMLPSRVLEAVDPIAYRCGFNNWRDSQSDDYAEVDGEYYDRGEVNGIRERVQDEIDAETEGAR